jgi:hypothetical protein
MSSAVSSHVGSRHLGIAIARGAVADLCDRIGTAMPPEARPGADLGIRREQNLSLPGRAVLLPTADGWVHPGPATVWATFADMVTALGATPPQPGSELPDLRSLAADAIDAEAGAWMLPAAAVRSRPAPAPSVPSSVDPSAVRGAVVVVLGTAWATPLVGLVLAQLGARVARVEHPGRPDPFPLRDRLARGQSRVALDLGHESDRDRFGQLLESADLLVDGHTPRVLANAGWADDVLRSELPKLAVLRLAAFIGDDRPGYGPAAECRGGWAARHDPPRLGRSSVADPVAGLLGVLACVNLLADRTGGLPRARVSLEDAVGHLFGIEARSG